MSESQLRLVKYIFSKLEDLKILLKIDDFFGVFSGFPLTIWLGNCVKIGK